MKELTEVMGYKFKNSKLLERALTHSSYSKENYERLEFLGDSILDFVVGDYLFSRVDESEGKLSKLRASFVSEQYLHKIFDELKISSYVKLGKSYKSELTKSVKADIFEAIVAGIYLDGGLEEAKKFIISTLKLGNYKTIKNTDYKSQIQEYYQALDKKNKITYKLLSQEGTPHKPTFTVGVLLNKEQIAVASGSSKHEAEQRGAESILKKLKKASKGE